MILDGDRPQTPCPTILGSKHLDTLPPRILRFQLSLDRFDFGIQHIPGNQMYTANTLSHFPLLRNEDSTLEELAELAMDASISSAFPVAQHSTIWSKLKLQIRYVPS